MSGMHRCSLVFIFVCFLAKMAAGQEEGSGLSVLWSLHEQSPPGVVVGNLREALTARDFNTSGVEFKFLPKPNQDLGQLTLDGVRGVLRTSGSVVPIDRELMCPPRTVNCSFDISIGLIKQLQLIQVIVEGVYVFTFTLYANIFISLPR